MAEWFKAPVLKTGVPARVPWVRIPPLPPEPIENILCFQIIGFVRTIERTTAFRHRHHRLGRRARSARSIFHHSKIAATLVDAIRLVQKVVAIAQRLLGVLLQLNPEYPLRPT